MGEEKIGNFFFSHLKPSCEYATLGYIHQCLRATVMAKNRILFWTIHLLTRLLDLGGAHFPGFF
jgi:hypothetical protein